MEELKKEEEFYEVDFVNGAIDASPCSVYLSTPDVSAPRSV